MAHNYQGGYQPPYQGQPPPQGYGQHPPQGYGQPLPMQNQQYPVQGHQPQPGWGQQPPPGQYGAPQGQYGAPPPPPGNYQQPPPGQYGAPPPNQYAPPQGQYGAPPPPGQYGAPAPPPGQYGAHPPQHHGAPPAGHYPPGGYGGPATPPSLGYGPQRTANINFSADVEAIRKAMKGFGANEKVLIGIMAKKDPIQIATIRAQYNQYLMRNLIDDLISELSGYFERGMVEIARGPLDADCYNVMEAIKGLGTNETILDDVLIGRSNADMNAIRQRYPELFKRSLEADIRGDLSGATEEMYMMIIGARRAEDSQPVIPLEIDQDVAALHNSLGTMLGKNATQVCQILTSKNDAQLRAISEAYHARFQKDLDSALKSSFSGHMQSALRLLVHRGKNRADAEAVRLEESMAGIGTKDVLLVQRVVRCHWDSNFMNAVSAAYKHRFKKELVKRIEGEIRGSYQKLMVACVKPGE